MYTVTNNGNGTVGLYDLSQGVSTLAQNNPNGYANTTANPNPGGGRQAIGQLELGAWNAVADPTNNGLHEASAGSVSEVNIFNRVLSPAEMQEMQTYLQAKWMGIGTSGALSPISPMQIETAPRWTLTAPSSRSPR